MFGQGFFGWWMTKCIVVSFLVLHFGGNWRRPLLSWTRYISIYSHPWTQTVLLHSQLPSEIMRMMLILTVTFLIRYAILLVAFFVNSWPPFTMSSCYVAPIKDGERFLLETLVLLLPHNFWVIETRSGSLLKGFFLIWCYMVQDQDAGLVFFFVQARFYRSAFVVNCYVDVQLFAYPLS
jgi:hypothetical protein